MTSVVKDKNSWVSQQNAQLLRLRKSNTPRGPGLERSWQQGAEAPWEGNRQKRPKGLEEEEEKAPGKTQTKARWAQEAGPPRDRKLQVSRQEARRHRTWAARESQATS